MRSLGNRHRSCETVSILPPLDLICHWVTSTSTYTGRATTKTTTTIMMTCTHHHFLRWALIRAPTLGFGAGRSIWENSVVFPSVMVSGYSAGFKYTLLATCQLAHFQNDPSPTSLTGFVSTYQSVSCRYTGPPLVSKTAMQIEHRLTYRPEYRISAALKYNRQGAEQKQRTNQYSSTSQ